MSKLKATLAELERRFVAWAEARDDIRAAVVMGSQARTDHPADEWSDLDIIVFAHHPDELLNRTDWLEDIAPVWISFINRTAGGELERLALFEDGLNVDFVFVPYEHLVRAAREGIIPEGYRRGARSILDKDGLATRLIPSSFSKPSFTPPTPEQFAWAVNAFWYTTVYVAKQLRRGDLWLVKVRHGNLLEIVIQMIETHAHVDHGADYDTWHMGRFVREWGDPRAVQALDGVFARFDATDSWRALLATMDLFRWLARETAERLGYPYPVAAEEHATEWVLAHCDISWSEVAALYKAIMTRLKHVQTERNYNREEMNER